MKENLKFDRSCNQCLASTGAAVMGAGPDDLSHVRLIVISDYPGVYETDYNLPQIPNSWIPKRHPRSLPSRRNSGQLLRETLQKMGLCPWSEVYYTNALKCNPDFQGRKLTLTEKEQTRCPQIWLTQELALLDRHVPNVPILLAGSRAVFAATKICANQIPKASMAALRRRKDLWIGSHPVVVTFNPAAVSRSDLRIEAGAHYNQRSGRLEINEVVNLPPVIASPLWIFYKDLELLKPWLSASPPSS